MRWRLLPATLVTSALVLAASGCDYVTQDDMKKVWQDGYRDAAGTQHAGLHPYLVRLATAVCQLEAKATVSSALDDNMRQCPGGGPEIAPPPKYPPA